MTEMWAPRGAHRYHHSGHSRAATALQAHTGAEMIETVRHVGYKMKSATPTSKV